MECYYYLNDGAFDTRLGMREESPECGKDFCDSCGDCLACDGFDPCYGAHGEEHFWVWYVTQAEWDALQEL